MLIYTFFPNLNHTKSILTVQDHIELYKICIKNNNKYDTSKIYTTEPFIEHFIDIVDECEIIPENFRPYFQDDIKFYVFEKETPPYTLIDGDIYLKQKLKYDNNREIEFEVVVEKIWYDRIMRNFLTNNGIKQEIKYWEDLNYTYNLGIIRVNKNQKILNSFLKEYKKVVNFYKSKVETKYPNLRKEVVIEMATCAYFLTLFLHTNNISTGSLKEKTPFIHYSGIKDKVELLVKHGVKKKQLL